MGIWDLHLGTLGDWGARDRGDLGVALGTWHQLFLTPPAPPDVLVLLLTDVLVFLQEKDQKFTFPTLVRAASGPRCPQQPAPPALCRHRGGCAGSGMAPGWHRGGCAGTGMAPGWLCWHRDVVPGPPSIRTPFSPRTNPP